jgi:alkanesulfonate monooxygenase SsuD/methylene tetrahydromethanopterin reductase-like flavin-dependent oxidoreductase (luciferase family)
MGMEFGLFNSLYVPRQLTDRDPGAEHRRLMDEVAVVQAADRAGFKYTWATEHHFLTEYSHLSANEVFLGYLAHATERIHLGSGIFNITPPVNHPARVAERVAMLDHLSEGRFEFGMGRGSSTTEQRGFGIPDPDSTRDMFDDVVGEFRRMWSTDEYPGHDGPFFSMPARNVLPKPYTKPHPPLWVAAGSPSTFEKAGRMGLGVLCFTMFGPEPLKPLIESYKNAIANAEPVGDYVNDNVMVTTQMLCLQDGQRVRELAGSGTLSQGYQNSLVFRYLDTFPKPPEIPVWPELIPEPTPADIDERIDARLAMYGTPEEVGRTAEAYAAAGVDQVVFGLLSSTISRDLALEAIETFGTHVLPEFDRDPVHSTTRQRERARAV